MISVLIPTYNRKEWLSKTLKCIENQTYRDFEVVIVDASAPVDQLEDSDLGRLNFKLKYLRYGMPGNVSRQRNIALGEAIGDILLFIDDDVEFDENLFSNYSKLFGSGEYEAISGLVETKKFKRGGGPIRDTSNHFLNIGRDNFQRCDFEVRTYVICTANFALLRKVYDKVGGFDENIYGVFDDVDYGFKLEYHGIDVVHHPEVSVFHFQAPAQGARSKLLPEWWAYYNISYFHLKNLKPNRAKFFFLVSLQMLRPSKAWLRLPKLINNYSNFVVGFLKARKNLTQFVSKITR